MSMHYYRITKYNPFFRDVEGVYTKDEWTSCSDIGSVFNDQVFTVEEYVKIEDMYINTISIFMDFLNVSFLKVKDLEIKHLFENSDLPCASETSSLYFSIQNNKAYEKKEALLIARLCLRNNVWCRLESDDMFVHFGYDYYMYIGEKKNPHNVIKQIEKMGLFVEPIESSPYSDR